MFADFKTGLLITLGAILGCGQQPVETGPVLIPIRGTLTLDGQPLPFKSVQLSPTAGTAGRGAAAFSDGQGRFQMKAIISDAIEDFAGCPPGRYRIVVTEPLIPISDRDFEAAHQEMIEEAREPEVAILLSEPNPNSTIPDAYKTDHTSPLEIVIDQQTQTLAIELDSKAIPRAAPEATPPSNDTQESSSEEQQNETTPE
ncbi:hypothetical protein EC9_51280 [Rosistilla ulvae]|uniref:Carboxypeptidase regulatory-like domain-containing protein n=1 Tax=Rosistilla ulvae TaxID=1930277 RepID=A0A517M7P5_9BACT|nr:hypothetical protein [Rosistilla ulvae]QDS90910.1 hypothetical protein EC9_51280 [Rosistilla ulvae]